MLTFSENATVAGKRIVTVKAFYAEFLSLGYVVDRSLDCRSIARYMTGDHAGEGYQCCSTGLREADSGLSAFNVNARRDENYRRMQQLRQEIVAEIKDGYALEV